MDKNIIRYALKNVFKKTKIICPNCGTIQDYKNIKCSKCNQSLDGLKDNTLKIKNCIRVGIGIVFLSLVAVVAAIIINNSMRKGLTTDNTVYVENKTSSLAGKTSEPMTTKKSDNETSPEVTKATTEASTTEQVTTETPIVPETKAAEMPTTELQKPTEEPTTPVPIKQNVTELKDETVNGVVNKLCTAIREGRNSDDKSLKVLYESMTYVIDDAKGNVDALYINVDMGKKQNGIEIAKHVLEEVPNIKVIFTSSLLKDAVDIFTIDPVYFLVKPYSSDYVRDSIYKLMNIIQEEQTDLITIKSAENKGRLVTIKTRDIYYIESELRVAHIYTIDNLYTTYMTLDEIQNKLKNNFLRCHRSFIVNSDKIKKFIKQGFILFNDKFVPISRSKSIRI